MAEAVGPGGGLGPWLHLAHVAGVLVYAGGAVVGSKVLASLADAPAETRAATAAAVRGAYLRLVLPFGVLMLGSGLWLLLGDPDGRHYLKDPAFHVKLTLVAALLGVEHALVLRPLRGVARGTLDPTGRRTLLAASHGAVVALVLAILFALFVLRKGP